jgi:MraZ protein
MELQGTTVNAVDVSGRIALREHQIDALPKSVVLTQGFDGNILVLTGQQWAAYQGRLIGGDMMDPDADDLRRLFIAPATEMKIDERGRLKIPEHLREWAGIQPGECRVMVLDIGTRYEIWEEGRYHAYMSGRAEELKRIAREHFSHHAGGEG